MGEETASPTDSVESLSPEDIRRTLHELRLHQVELEMQNEELRRTQTELDASRARYFDLYDLSPVGYVTLSEQGLILEANLTVASLLGVTRTELVTQALCRFVFKDDRDTCYGPHRRLFASREPQAYDVRMVKEDGTVFWASIAATASQYAAGEPVCRMTLSDITERKRAEAALRESEERYATTLAALDDGLWDWHVPSGNAFFSPIYYAMLGYENREFPATYDSWRQLVHPDDIDRVEQELRQSSESGGRFAIDLRMKMKSGGWRWVSTRGKTVERDADARAVRMVGTLTDITERKRVDDALRERVKELNCLYRVADLVGKEDSLEKILQACAELTPNAWSHPDIACARIVFGGRPYQTGNFRESQWRQSADLLVHGQPVGTIEVCYLEERPIRDEGPFLREERSLINGLAERLGKVAERKRAEEEVASTLSLLESTMEATADGILVADGKGRMVRFNKQFQEMWRIPEALTAVKNEEAALSFVLGQLKEPESFIRTVRDLYDTPEAVSFDMLEFTDGRVFERYSRPQRIGDDVVGRVWSFRDITERKQTEAEKAALQAQLQQAQKLESVGRLAGGVAHEFNNMLGVILGHTELAMEQADATQPLHGDLEEIRKAATRSADLTRQLLAFARKQTVSPRVLELNETVAGTLKMLGRLIGEDIRITWQPGAKLWPVKIDPAQMGQILTNLCVNARDAIAGIGTITVATANVIDDADWTDVADVVRGEYVRVTVSDTGCGMNGETLSHLFEPFFSTKEFGQGAGLGLSSVLGAVEQNGGVIRVRSEPGAGTTFRIYLPRHVGQGEQARMDALAEPAKRGRETILLVEDEPAILTLTTRMLERQDYTVLAASTPSEAIRMATEHAGHIHLLMTDVVMPDMNGGDLSRHLQSIHPNIKRLFMSGYTADVIADHGVVDARVSFIQKPFSIKDLAAKVREALDRE